MDRPAHRSTAVEDRQNCLRSLWLGHVAAVCLTPDGHISVQEPPSDAIVPGAFNPLHEAHWALAHMAARFTGGPFAFELSIANVDKPPLSLEEVGCRLEQFAGKAPLWLTRAATFREKAALFPGTIFGIGADTAARIVDCRYYEQREQSLTDALDYLRRQGCRFLVAGRRNCAGKFVGLQDLVIPRGFADLFVAVPEAAFRIDISSTQLRLTRKPAG